MAFRSAKLHEDGDGDIAASSTLRAFALLERIALAHEPPSQRYTERTIVDIDALLRALAKIRTSSVGTAVLQQRRTNRIAA